MLPLGRVFSRLRPVACKLSPRDVCFSRQAALSSSGSPHSPLSVAYSHHLSETTNT